MILNWRKLKEKVGVSFDSMALRSPAELVGFTVAARALGRRARGGGALP